ncbi:hypothetical protein [Acetobacter orientalis]|uniref:hypothetical protein n=1 Tax=Acetobacter orientalis TaxID=146474 RepID=UPI0039ECFD7E
MSGINPIDLLPPSLKNHQFGGPGDIGSPEHRSLWLCGIEYGESENENGTDDEIENYTVALQWRNWTYNRNAFKLIASIEGKKVEDALSYAEQKKIFESSTVGYFQTNLFPVECRTLGTWTEDAKIRTGFPDKRAYADYIRSICFENMHKQLQAKKPRLFLGVGITHVGDFSQVVFGEQVELERHDFEIGGHKKTVFLRQGEIPFAVVSHLSSPSGLNSNEALETAGHLIRNMMRK